MTAGGPVYPANSGYAQIRELCGAFYGIPQTVLFSAEGLDLFGTDAEALVREAKKRIDRYFEG